MKLLLVGLFALGSTAGSYASAKDVYDIDGAHTSVVFKIDHLGFSHVYGRFNETSGTFTLDEANPKNNAVDLTIKASSIDTNNKKRDEHLNSPDFFNTKQFPNITFKSKSVKKVSDNKYEVVGDFNMHGKKKSLTLTVDRTRTGLDPWGKTRTGADIQLKLKRSDYGMSFMQGENQLGDEVEIMISLEGVKK